MDRVRYKDGPFSLKSAVKDKILRLAASRGFYRAPDIDYGVMKIDGLDRAYLLLQDQLSRDLFVKLLASGHRNRKILLPPPYQSLTAASLLPAPRPIAARLLFCNWIEVCAATAQTQQFSSRPGSVAFEVVLSSP